MTDNNDISFKNIKWYFNNLPNEIDLANCKDNTIKEILSVFDTDKKKGVLSQNEIINAISFFAKNDKFKEDGTRYFNISNDDAELIARKFNGGKYFGRDIKKAFDYIKNAFTKVQAGKDITMKQEAIAPLLKEIQNKELEYCNIMELIERNDGITTMIVKQNLQKYPKAFCSKKNGEIYIVDNGELKLLEGKYLQIKDLYCMVSSEETKDGFKILKGFDTTGIPLTQACSPDDTLIDDAHRAAEILGIKEEMESYGFLWLDKKPTGKYDVNRYSYKTWNDDLKGFVDTDISFQVHREVISYNKPYSYANKSLAEEYLLNSIEIIEENDNRVCKFKTYKDSL